MRLYIFTPLEEGTFHFFVLKPHLVHHTMDTQVWQALLTFKKKENFDCGFDCGMFDPLTNESACEVARLNDPAKLTPQEVAEVKRVLLKKVEENLDWFINHSRFNSSAGRDSN